MNKKLKTAATKNPDPYVAKLTDFAMRNGFDELVRRQDVEQLIEEKIDYVYEEEHNADVSQERASVEILQKILKDVQNEE